MISERLREFATSFGPAWIVMIADVDAPSVLTAAQIGATYSYGLIWFFILLIVPLFIIQEASGRIGAATGKGLGQVIRENYSKRVAVLASVPMATVDVISYVAEFTGIAIGMQLFGIPAYVSVCAAYLLQLALVVKRRFVTMERAMLIISCVLILAYAGSLVARGVSYTSDIFYFQATPEVLYLLAAGVGAVIMPFMLFYQASATAEKKSVHMWAMRTETLVGAIASEVGMIVIIMCSSGLNQSLVLAQPRQLAAALAAIAGAYAPYLFGVGLIAAGFLALIVISLASSWAIVDTLGWGRDRFFWVYALESLPGVVVPILYPNHMVLILNLMVVFVFVLVGPGVLLGLLASSKKIMGGLVSSRAWRIAYWVSLAAVIGFGIVALAASA